MGVFMKDKINELIDRLIGIDDVLSVDPAAKKLALYNATKIHKKQMEFHKCQKRNRWVFGGNRSGKTECGAVECVWLARGVHPYKQNKPVDGWVVSLSFGVQKDVSQKKILSYLPREWIEEIRMRDGRKDMPETGIIDCIVVRNIFGTFSTIGFKSAEEGREKFQGASLDFVWFDEEPPEDVWRECTMRVLDRSGEIFGTMTPLLGLTFVYNKIFLNEANDNETWCIFMSWEDNPYLPKAEIERMKATMSQEELEARKNGRFGVRLAGLVYDEFDVGLHVVSPFFVPQEWQSGVSIDPGLNNPLSCHFYAVDEDGNVYVVAEHYAQGKSVEYHASEILKIANSLGWKRGFGGKLEALIDSAALQKTLSSPKSVSELFFENGICTNANVNKDVFSGINRVKSFLRDGDGNAHLFVFSSCINMIREFKTYKWGAGDSPIKKDDHAMDEIRYFVMSRPESASENTKQTIIARHKERLIRKNRNKRHIAY